MSTQPCPICGLPPSGEWVDLTPAAHTTRVSVCPGCTAAVHERPSPGPARWLPSECVEDSRGALSPPSPAAQIATTRARLARLARHLPPRADAPRIAAVQRGPLQAVAGRHEGLSLEVVGSLEPHHPGTGSGFDGLLDATLGQVVDPLGRLRQIADALRPDGVALVVVPHLIAFRGDLLDDVLRPDVAVHFTPRAIILACRSAGLFPVDVEVADEIRVVCAKQPTASLRHVPEPTALAVAHAVWGRDVDRKIGIALAMHGPARHVLAMARRAHGRCPCPDARSDIALRIASAYEQCSDHVKAARWLRRSLDDRYDVEVMATLRMVERVTQIVDNIHTHTKRRQEVTERIPFQPSPLSC